MIRPGLVIALALTACGGAASTPPSNASTASSSSCATETAELRTWLAINADPAKPLPAPWPTGDAQFDTELDTWRAKLRERIAELRDPDGPVELVSGIKPGPYDAEIASCEPAKAATKAVSEAEGIEGRVAAWPKLADAIAECGCKPPVAHIKAHVYIIERGPN